jgi:hypothetical protein
MQTTDISGRLSYCFDKVSVRSTKQYPFSPSSTGRWDEKIFPPFWMSITMANIRVRSKIESRNMELIAKVSFDRESLKKMADEAGTEFFVEVCMDWERV